MIEQMKQMKMQLEGIVQGQMSNLQQVDAKELGEVIKMIENLSEAIYYCQIVEAMEDKDKENKYQRNHYYYTERYMMPYEYDYGYEYNRGRDMDRPYRMYYNGGGNGSSSGGSGGGNSNGSGSSSGGRNYSNGNGNNGGRGYREREWDWSEDRERMRMMRDPKEGRSYNGRRNYMESKEMRKDKTTMMKELEDYMAELSSDITEMIEGASAEEKQLLQKKIATLATKIQ